MIIIKRVLHIVDSLNIGGLETTVVNYYKYINKKEYDFTYLVFGKRIGYYEETIKKLGGTILRMDTPSSSYFNYVNDLRKIFRENGPYDIVHSHTLFNSGFVMKAAFLEEIPIRIAHSHTNRKRLKNSLIKVIYIKYMRYLIEKYANVFVACSQDAGKYLFGKTLFENQGTILTNAIDIENFTFNKDIRIKVRKEMDLEDKFVLGHTGSLNKLKNQSFLLDVLNKLIIDKPNIVLLLVGEGSQNDFLTEKANNYGLSDNVLFLGNKTNINDLLMAFDVFVFPSILEGLGISLIEAQSIGIPCLVSDNIPHEAIINKNVLELPLEVDKWYDYLVDLKPLDFESNKDVKKKYSLEVMLSQLENIYNIV